MILVLETSGSFPSVGVVDLNGSELYYCQHTEKQSHAEVLATLVADAIASVKGKGGPLLAIPGMHGLGKWYLDNNEKVQGVWVMIDARRDEVYATFVDRHSIERNIPQAMILPQEFPVNQAFDSFGFVVDCREKVSRLLSLGEESNVKEEFISVRHLYNSAILSFKTKKFSDVAYFEPFYLKEFQAGISKKFSVK